MGIASDIISDLKEKRQLAYDGIEYLQKNIITKDGTEKARYDSAIVSIDADLFSDVQNVNNKLQDVRSAYQARIDVGCRTDMFWRLVSISTYKPVGSPAGSVESLYNLQVSRLSIPGYQGVGLGTTASGPGTIGFGNTGGITYFTESGSYISYPPYSLFGFQEKNLYGLKYYDEPSQRDIGDTFVTSFIGTISIGSSILTVMSPIGSGTTLGIQTGQLITASKDEIFSLTSGEIVGIGTTIADLSVLSGAGNTIGIGTTSEVVIKLTLGSIVAVGASAPEQDGSYVTFTVLESPAGMGTTAISYYRIPFNSNPFSPQTIGIMSSSQYGIGKSIFYDNSGYNSNQQTWRPEFSRPAVINQLPEVKEPNVGAGKIYYTVGFSSYPAVPFVGGRASEGSTVSLTLSQVALANLYEDAAACPTQETNLTNAISIANSAEADIQTNFGDFDFKIDTVNALRSLRTDIQLEIWGNRQAIDGLADDIDRYDTAIEYLGVTTITSLLP